MGESRNELQVLNDQKLIAKSELEKLKNEKKNLKKTVSDQNLKLIEKLESLNQKISEKDVEIHQKEQDIKDINKEVETAKRMIKKTQTELEGTLDKEYQTELDDLANERDIIDELVEINTNILRDTSDYIRIFIEEKNSNKYLKFIWKPTEYNWIKFNKH